jgi:hypothetical protein
MHETRTRLVLSFARGFAPVLALCACSESNPELEGEPQGGTGGAPTSTEAPECATAFGPTDPTLLIDDIEDGNGLLRPIGTRNGSWWLSSDGSAGTIAPPADAAPTPERIPGTRCGSSQAMRVTGQGFTLWGAVLTAAFRYDGREASVDFSGLRGVMFWARVGETNNGSVRVQFQDSTTQPEGGHCDAAPESPNACYNGFGVELAPLDTEWRLYKLDFERMTQREGFGLRAPALDTTAVYSLNWGVESNSVFDLWVDDVWLYE